MKINEINNNQSFIFKPLKIIQSLGWAVVAILALPTVVGSYFAWKKLVDIWSKNERPDTKKTAEVVSEIFMRKTTEALLKDWVERAPDQENRLTAQKRILHFLEHPEDLLDLSNLGLSSLPSIFEDERFSRLQELYLAGNPFTGLLFIKNLNARIIFKESPWYEQHLSKGFTNRLLDQNLGEEESFEDLLTQPSPTPLEIKKKQYEVAIAQFESPGCLSSCSAEVYLDYLKDINPAFHFNTCLLKDLKPVYNEFLKTIEVEVKETKEKNGSLFFVPFLLAGNLLREQHIVVAVINLKEEKIEYFDPKGNQVYFIFGNLVDRSLSRWDISIQEFLEELSRAIFPDQKTPSINRNRNYPQSLRNRVDCGAHALEFIEKRLSYGSLEEASSHLVLNGRQLRSELANTLKANLENK
ncbi:MAG: hypothetical protein LBC45_01545 [Chlamydiales bacterium]|jgi:hypothetical protein|nr:hypothetical protein [Chlamydiales bacterium]